MWVEGKKKGEVEKWGDVIVIDHMRVTGICDCSSELARKSSSKDLPVFRITSGARYSGVPQSVYVSAAHRNQLKSPFSIHFPSQRQRNGRERKDHTLPNALRKSKIHQLQMPL